MHRDERVLVVGTTSDYIQWIREASPGGVLFLTAPEVRRKAPEPEPAPGEELLYDLSDPERVWERLAAYLSCNTIRLSGVACFDCESLGLAALIAERLGLSFASREAVNNCRDKFLSKSLWHRTGVDCPQVQRVRSAGEVLAFFRKNGGPCVLKPISGSGSELVYRCDDEKACRANFKILREAMAQRRRHPLGGTENGIAPGIIVETYIPGDEFSCDFIVDGDCLDLVRVTRKIKSEAAPFGTIHGYELSDGFPGCFPEGRLAGALMAACRALSLSRGLCMADFIVREGRIIFLEITPRPGGDCLPWLLRCARGLDMLHLALAVARGQRRIPKPTGTARMIGARIHAGRAGILCRLDPGDALRDPRVREVRLIRRTGDAIHLPPRDYDSWLLGHIILSPGPDDDPAYACRAVCEKIIVEIRQEVP